MELPDILQWIAGGRKTGTLYLRRRSVEKRIVFEGGSVYTSYSNDPREYLGQYLLRTGLVSEEQLFKALLRQEKEGRALGAILIGDGLLEESALRTALVSKAEESIYDLFLWPEGAFEFKEGELPRDIPVHLAVEVTALVMEGVRRLDEWGRIRQAFPTSTTTLRVSEGAAASDPLERRLLGLAAGGRSIAEMALETRRSDFEVASVLLGLHDRGLVAIAEVGDDPWSADAVGGIRDLLAVGERRLKEKRFDAALEAFEQVLTFDRLNQTAKKGLIAVIEARDRERALRTVPLDKVPVVALDFQALTRENFDPQEGFVLSRVNGAWDVRSILKLCPMPEEDALLIFARLLARKAITLQ